MKKRFIYFIFVVYLLLPTIIYADKLKIECPDSIVPESEFTCNLIGETETMVSGVSAYVNISDSLSLEAVLIADKWQGDGQDGDIQIFINPEVKGEFNIGTLKLKSNGNNNGITVSSIIFYDENVKKKKIDSVSTTIKVKEDAKNPSVTVGSNSLVDLQIDNHDINFYKEEKEYTLVIEDEEKLDITPVLEDKSATYEITGNENLKNGSKITINITSSDGKKNAYIIKIKKAIIDKGTSTILIIVIGILVLINATRIILKKVKRGKKK